MNPPIAVPRLEQPWIVKAEDFHVRFVREVVGEKGLSGRIQQRRTHDSDVLGRILSENTDEGVGPASGVEQGVVIYSERIIQVS